MDYLARCIQSSGAYGTQGGITAQYANDLAKLACESLTDSDAATRKAGADVLRTLLNSKDDFIVSVAKKITSSLQATNPRALKSLVFPTNNGIDQAQSRPRSAPDKSFTRATGQEKSSERSNKVTKPAGNMPRPFPSGPGVPAEIADDMILPSFEDSVGNINALNIPKWGDDIDNGGILAGIQCESYLEPFYFFAILVWTHQISPLYYEIIYGSLELEGESSGLESA